MNSQAYLNTIHHGDCIDVLANLPAEIANIVITDPPYLVRYKDRSGRSLMNDATDAWLAPAFKQIYRALKPDSLCVSFYGWHRVDDFMAAWRAAGFYPVGHIVWTKRYSSNSRFLAYRHEQAYLLAKGRPKPPESPIPDTLPWVYSHNRIHPTEKSPAILSPLIESLTRPDDVVLDPFAGSGSTLVAAKELGREWFGVELDPKHAASANACLKGTLFNGASAAAVA
jgi:site-specific DNA-methyltransferase (adenine-specific)